MEKKKKGLILTVLGIVSLVLVTVGVTYAFFNYVKEGSKENTITSGTLTFLYTEVDQVGRGISIEEALPTSDENGKKLTGEGKVFNFKVTSTLMGNYDILYHVTARKKSDSTLDESKVRIYLTEEIGSVEKELLLDSYNKLTDYENAPTGVVEKIIYEGLVPTGSTSYEKNFNLRMWLDESVDYSPVKDEDGNDIYPYNDKEFTITVNVYASGKVVTAEEIDMANTTKISKILVNGTEATSSEDENYDYYQELAVEEKEARIEVETVNEEAQVEVTRLEDTTAYNTRVKRLSTVGIVKLPLEAGDNLFNVKVTSANKKVENEYVLKITTKDKTNPTVSGSLTGKVVTISYSDNVGITEYIVTTETTAPSDGWTSIESSNEGTIEYKLPDIGTYSIYVKDNEGNITKSENSYTPETSLFYPTVTASLSGKVITINYSDDIGVASYAVTTSASTPSSGWTEITTNKQSGSIQYTTTSSQTYHVYVKNTLGYVTKAEGTFTPASTLFCAYSTGKTWTYDYSGSSTTFTVPCNGTYKLEVWGAQGGNNNGTGGTGGYSYGNIILLSNSTIYVVVGGQGKSSSNSAGGYNGGGAGGTSEGAGGGGATHIAIGNTNRGVLSKYASYKDEILIVAGGGGGAAYATLYTSTPNGGTGGGTSGGTGVYGSDQCVIGYGGTQSAGGNGASKGSFGIGGSNVNSWDGGGGGGGYYGGGSGGNCNGGRAGGGGSGYLNTSKLISGTTGMINGQRTGNGQAKITLVSLN